MTTDDCGHRAVQAYLTSLGWLAAHVWRHLRLWQIQASQKSQMAPTSAMPLAFFPPCGTQQSLPRHLHRRTRFPEHRFGRSVLFSCCTT